MVTFTCNYTHQEFLELSVMEYGKIKKFTYGPNITWTSTVDCSPHVVQCQLRTKENQIIGLISTLISPLKIGLTIFLDQGGFCFKIFMYIVYSRLAKSLKLHMYVNLCIRNVPNCEVNLIYIFVVTSHLLYEIRSVKKIYSRLTLHLYL